MFYEVLIFEKESGTLAGTSLGKYSRESAEALRKEGIADFGDLKGGWLFLSNSEYESVKERYTDSKYFDITVTEWPLDNEALRRRFIYLLLTYDFYYAYSDDGRVYRSGKRHGDMINTVAAFMPSAKVAELWNKYIVEKYGLGESEKTDEAGWDDNRQRVFNEDHKTIHYNPWRDEFTWTELKEATGL